MNLGEQNEGLSTQNMANYLFQIDGSNTPRTDTLGSAREGVGVIVGGGSTSTEQSSDFHRELEGRAFWGRYSG